MTIPQCTEISQLERRIAALERELDYKSQVIARQADALAQVLMERPAAAHSSRMSGARG